MKILTWEILQSAPNDPKRNSRNWASKVPYTCAENFEKKKNIVWRYGGEGATHKIWPRPMQWFPRNLSLQATDGQTYVRYIAQLWVCATFFARRCATIKGVLTNGTLCGFLSMTCGIISPWFVGLFVHDICNH